MNVYHECDVRQSRPSTRVIVAQHKLSNTTKYQLLMWTRAVRRSGMGVLHVGVDVGAGDAEVDVSYVSFIVSVQYIGY